MRNCRTALYRMYGDGDELLYIGISKNFGQRWTAEACTHPWWPMVSRQTVQWYDTRPEAHAAEVEAIHAEKPRFNVVHTEKERRPSRGSSVRTRPAPVAARGITLGPGVTPEMAARLDLFDLFSDPRVDEALRIEASEAYLRLGRETAA